MDRIDPNDEAVRVASVAIRKELYKQVEESVVWVVVYKRCLKFELKSSNLTNFFYPTNLQKLQENSC